MRTGAMDAQDITKWSVRFGKASALSRYNAEQSWCVCEILLLVSDKGIGNEVTHSGLEFNRETMLLLWPQE